MNGNGSVRSANLIQWQRVSIAALLLALILTGFYSSHQIRLARVALRSSEQRASIWREQADQSQALLRKERDITDGLKSCMTFDRTYIHSLEVKLSRYEAFQALEKSR